MMDEVFIGVFFAIAIVIGILLVSNIGHNDRESYNISCLELNLGKETCDKIFNNKK